MVSEHTGAAIEHIENLRDEDDSEHFYDPEREVLDQLGYEPSCSIQEVFERTYEDVERYRNRVPVDELRPDVYCDEREKVAADGGPAGRD